jgi:hypothetical protein
MASSINSDNGVVSGSAGLKYSSDSSGALALQTNGNTAVTVATTGAVGINNTSPNTLLCVGSGGAQYGGGLALNRGPGVYNFLEISDGTNNLMYGLDNSLTYAKLGSVTTYPIALITGNAERARINTYGLGIGGAIPTSGYGIAFPASQSASTDPNTLDDYEEGTWTPVLGTGSSPPTFTYTNRGGTYIKVGLQVTAWFYLNINVTSSGTGFAGLVTSSLPFVPENVTYTNSAYTMGGFALAQPSATGGVVLVFNNDNPNTANRLYWTNPSGGQPTGVSGGLSSGLYSGYAVYRAAS